MCDSHTPIASDLDRAEWQAEFVRILPKIQRLAQITFRKCGAELREELIEEVVADSWIWFRRLCELGRRRDAHPSVLAKFSIKRIGSGVRVGSPRNRCDVGSRYGELQSGIRVRSLTFRDTETGSWREMLVESRRATPAQLAASRIDFQTWLDSLSSRDREIAIRLASGEEVRHIAKWFGVTSGRICQKRREFKTAWFSLHGLDRDGREIETAA